MTKLRWKKRRSGLLVPEPLWFIQVYLPRERNSPHGEILRAHYWSEDTKTFVESAEPITAFRTKKQAEAVLFWITAKYAKSIIGQDMKIKLVKGMSDEAFEQESVPDRRTRTAEELL